MLVYPPAISFQMRPINSPYAPISLKNQFWWEFSQVASKKGYVTRAGAIASNLNDIVVEKLVMPLVDHSRALGDQSAILGTALSLRHWVPLVGQYELNGKQIFDLDDHLVEMLSNTGLGDTTLKDWNPVYNAFYIHFGKQESCKLEYDLSEAAESKYEYFDGVFVSITKEREGSDDRRIKLGLTTVKDDGSRIVQPGYFLDLNPAEQSMKVLDGVEAALQRRERELYADIEDDEDKTISDMVIEKHREATRLMQSAAPLIVNGMYYLSEYKSDQKKQPGRDSPISVKQQWRSAGSKKKEVLTRIERQGYTIVRMCGAQTAARSAKANTGKQVDTHWRRGHWRSQPHGEGRTERKLIWIMPMLVGNQSKEPARGHVYKTPST